MGATGFTKARSMGPVADAVERAGGSLARVFRLAELPLRLIEQPDQLILLRDQLALVECAAREIGDEALPLRLSLTAGFESLGAFGQYIGAAPVFAAAIERCNAGMGSLLQSATHVRLVQAHGFAAWSYEISDSARVGRQKNELLAFGYMVDLLRRFLGATAAPLRVELPGAVPARAYVQDMLGCEISRGDKAALIFPRDWLEAANPRPRAMERDGSLDDMPDPDDFAAGVTQLIKLGLLERRPTIEWVSRKLRLSKRTLQRRLFDTNESFEELRRGVLTARAAALLKSPGMSLSEIAYELGYADPAHFTRAARKWVGQTPRQWRRRLATPPAKP